MRIIDHRQKRPYRQHPILADTDEFQEFEDLYVAGPDPHEVRTGACVPCECRCPSCGEVRSTDVRGWYLTLKRESGKGFCRPCSNRARATLPILSESDYWEENHDLWVDGPDPSTITMGSKEECTVRCRDCGKERHLQVKAWATKGGRPFCNVCSNRRRREKDRAEREEHERRAYDELESGELARLFEEFRPA